LGGSRGDLVLVLVGDIAEDRLAHRVARARSVEEADDPLRLLERLHQA
jgi:hypothetical protein